ncbi:6-phosphofructokinase beta subunit [Suhomyces tanzawaensis NRRL Y-17324]|uniref:ATP-dependent 6-phosphofructokinase n=1 Tax=Suhomyces tanzawaensis NRRL Y-17324 TaxID=984487 RepID=A0A1E4SMM7_9ASCO|nr:6-phosphofructokinase beta subunit [Suhomyces tanzawaensis NRRL Y-17324]ODV80745.1 6-phosphofructokinase beta subunit [Suhomyces tanzawaensis NRRL Y-17324]
MTAPNHYHHRLLPLRSNVSTPAQLPPKLPESIPLAPPLPFQYHDGPTPLLPVSYTCPSSGHLIMTVPIVNGSASVTIHAATKTLLDDTITFYSNVLGLALHSESSDAVFLSNKDQKITIKIVVGSGLSADEVAHKKAALAKRLNIDDWRTSESSVVFRSTNLNRLIATFQLSQLPVQVNPNELYPNEVYTIDPVGTLIGFTACANPLTLVPPVEKYNPVGAESTAVSASVSELSRGDEGVKPRRNIAVMTSGGDAPGMNANVRAVVRAAIFRGCKAYAVMEGYEGLVRGGPEYIKEMTWHDVKGYLSEGGTKIGTARCMAFKERKGRLQGCKHLIEAGIDALIVCGGDGSLTGADLFRSEWPSLIDELRKNGDISEEKYQKHKHLNICGTVGLIDNDMATTDATIGAYSSLDRICKAIDYIDATANSHSRAFVVEVMGRHCGWLALMAGIATSADYILIPEKPSSSQDWQDQMCKIVSKHRAKGKRKSIVIVAEGAITSDLQPISANNVKDVLVDRLGLDTRVTTLGHVQRGGNAVAYDRFLATLQGVEAVKAVLDCTPDTPSPLIAIDENKLVRKPLVEAVKITKSVATAIENKDFDKAMSLRDSEFCEHLSNYMAMNSANHNEPTLPVEKRKKIAIINVGAPAGGMNSAVYSMATYCMSRGHTPYAIHNGFSGLARHESVRSMDWLDIEGWNSIGGSEIGTNRQTPEDTDLGMIAYYFEKYQFDGLIIIGGFEAFLSLEQLEKARPMYPAFRIPIVLIPATISNNVPGTEYSLGADTCLNSLMDYCDVVKQSASSTRDRAFVIEVQGGNSGYIATCTSLISGAQASYVPEEGISLDQLELDIRSLKESFATERGLTKSGKLIIKSTNASKVLSTQVLADIIKYEAGNEFDTKTAVPGHVQQGGLPSPIDRTRAARFAVKAVQFVEDNSDLLADVKYSPDFPSDDKKLKATAVVLGIKSSHLRFSPIRKLYDFETELGRRMPKKIHWATIRDVADQLVGRTRIERPVV